MSSEFRARGALRHKLAIHHTPSRLHLSKQIAAMADDNPRKRRAMHVEPNWKSEEELQRMQAVKRRREDAEPYNEVCMARLRREEAQRSP